jgi:hypothetical protein
MYAVFEPDFTALPFDPCFTNGSKNLELASSDVALLVYQVPLIGGTLGHDGKQRLRRVRRVFTRRWPMAVGGSPGSGAVK